MNSINEAPSQIANARELQERIGTKPEKSQEDLKEIGGVVLQFPPKDFTGNLRSHDSPREYDTGKTAVGN